MSQSWCKANPECGFFWIVHGDKCLQSNNHLNKANEATFASECVWMTVFIQLWADVSPVLPQESLPSRGWLVTSWPRIPTSASPWGRTKTSASCSATTAGVISTTTPWASALGNATTATFTEELWKEPEQISSPPFPCSCGSWRCPPETLLWSIVLLVVESQTVTTVC